MQRIATFFLATVLSFNMFAVEIHAEQLMEQKQVIVEDNYSTSDVYRIVRVKNGYDKITLNGRERHKQTVQSTKAILQLPMILDLYETKDGFLTPSDINGIVIDRKSVV